MLKVKGIIKVEESKSRIVVETSQDIIDYYNFFITRQYWIRLQKPLHEAHVTIANVKFHDNIDWKKAQKYHNKEIVFEYDPYLIRGGYTKGFVMFYLKVFSEEIDKIKKDLDIIERDTYKGLHLTVATSKNSVIRPYWPEMIEVK